MAATSALVFYVSGHGFGHAARVIEVINAILVRRPETRIGVRTAAPRWLFDLTVKGKITFSTLETDTGVVQIDYGGAPLRVVAIVAPRQPLDPETSHVPLIGKVAIERGKVIVSEAWYGSHDGDCCASGRARTTWTYAAGKLRPTRTTILEKP